MRTAAVLTLAAMLMTALCPRFEAARAEVVDAIAAVVNGRVVTKSEVDRELAQAGAPLEDAKLREKALEAVIERFLIEDRAAKMRVTVTDEEVNQTTDRIRNQLKLDPLAFRGAVAKQGFTWEQYTSALRSEILRTRVFSYAMREELKLDDERLREYYLKNAESFSAPSRARFLHVKAPKGSGLADLLRKKVEGGADFSKTSVDLLGNEPYDSGSLDENSLVPEFKDALAQTQVDSLSQVVRMPDGDYLLKVLEKTPGAPAPFEQVKDKVRERFTSEGTQELFRNWIEQLKRRASIQRMM